MFRLITLQVLPTKNKNSGKIPKLLFFLDISSNIYNGLGSVGKKLLAASFPALEGKPLYLGISVICVSDFIGVNEEISFNAALFGNCPVLRNIGLIHPHES